MVLNNISDHRLGTVKACNFQYQYNVPADFPAGAIMLQFIEKPSCRVGSKVSATVTADSGMFPVNGVMFMKFGPDLKCQ